MGTSAGANGYATKFLGTGSLIARRYSCVVVNACGEKLGFRNVFRVKRSLIMRTPCEDAVARCLRNAVAMGGGGDDDDDNDEEGDELPRHCPKFQSACLT